MPKLVTIAVVVVCLVVVATLFWLFRDGNDDQGESPNLAERASILERTESPEGDNGIVPTPAVLPMLAEVSQRCTGLFSEVPSVVDLQSGERQLADDCMRALDALFMESEVSTTVVRLDVPMTWRDVFDDLARKEKSVRSAIEEPSCHVGEDEIRSELSERCSARDMAELAVFREVCGHVKSGSRRYYVPPKSGDHLIRGVDYPEYAESLDSEHRHQWIEALDSDAGDQEAYWAKRGEVDTLLLRTAWLRNRCVAAGSPQSWSVRDAAVLMSHSASLGDGFALAHHRGTRERTSRLLEIDPIQAYVNLAVFDAELVNDEWELADAEAHRVAKAPYIENRRQLLSMSGVDCPAPCTSDQLHEIETRKHVHIQFHWAECGLTRECSEDLLRRRDELRAPLFDIELELARTEAARSLPYRKRAEVVKASYVLAIRMLAEATGVELNSVWLRRIADVENPQSMDADDLGFALARARALVDQQLEIPHSGYN